MQLIGGIMRLIKILLLSTTLSAFAIPAYAELNLWQQNFVGCSTSSSPYATEILFQDADKVRPLMQIAGMNAWAVSDGKGGQQLALTTPDGLTIYGRVVGPQGEDISGALLGTTPTMKPTELTEALPKQPLSRSFQPAGQQQAVAGQAGNLEQPVIAQQQQQQQSAIAQAVGQQDLKNRPMTSQGDGSIPALPLPGTGMAGSAATVPVTGGAVSTTPGIGSQTVLNVPQASNLEQLMKQAEEYAMWFPMNEPKPGAPLVYMFVDPTCPHCAWSLEHLDPKIRDGSVNVRAILAPILSEEAFHIGMSIMHSDNIPESLLQQAKLAIGSKGTPVKRIDPAQYDERVKQGIARNVQWMRANGVPGVPFYLFRTNQKVEFAFGSLSDQQLATALPALPAATGDTQGQQPKAGQIGALQ